MTKLLKLIHVSKFAWSEAAQASGFGIHSFINNLYYCSVTPSNKLMGVIEPGPRPRGRFSVESRFELKCNP